MRSVVGIILGEAAGIGPEIIAKALNHQDLRMKASWLIIGDERVWQSGQNLAATDLGYELINDLNMASKPVPGQIMLYDLKNTDPQQVTAGKLSEYSARATVETIRKAIGLCKSAGINKLLYGPLCKEGFKLSGVDCISEGDYFTECLQEDSMASEINILDDMWIGRVTSHLPISQVAAQITEANVFESIRYLAEQRRNYSNDQVRIAVASLNPHSGEGGLLGDEEITAIRPAIAKANEQLPAVVEGPFPPDTIMRKALKGYYNGVLSMYHDQVQSGMKLIAFGKGVTLFPGLSIIFATPAHGVAFDIAGQGIAEEDATISALTTLVKLGKN